MKPAATGVSFVIPAYNEEISVASTIDRLEACLSKAGVPHEIVVVDDGSSDGTRQAAIATGKARVLGHPINTGYGSAIKTGIMAASHDWIGIVDADGTYEIEKAPDLYSRMCDGFDMVVAVRTNVRETDGPIKRWTRPAMLAMLNLLIAARIVDANCGFRIFTRELAMTFFPFLCNTFSFTTSLTVFALGEGFFVGYVPTTYAPRVGRTKVRHFRDSLRMMQLILQGTSFFNPVKLLLILAVAVVVFVGVPALVMGSLGWLFAASLYTILGATAVILFALGVVADIVRIATASSFTRSTPRAVEFGTPRRRKRNADS